MGPIIAAANFTNSAETEQYTRPRRQPPCPNLDRGARAPGVSSGFPPQSGHIVGWIRLIPTESFPPFCVFSRHSPPSVCPPPSFYSSRLILPLSPSFELNSCLSPFVVFRGCGMFGILSREWGRGGEHRCKVTVRRKQVLQYGPTNTTATYILDLTL